MISNFSAGSIENYLSSGFNEVVRTYEASISHQYENNMMLSVDFREIIDFVSGKKSGDCFDTIPPSAEIILLNSLMENRSGNVIVCAITIRSSLIRLHKLIVWSDASQIANFGRFTSKVESILDRARQIGWTADFQSEVVTLPSTDEVVAIVENYGDEQLKRRMASTLLRRMPDVYAGEQDRASAKRLAEAAYLISATRVCDDANNVGYLYMAEGNLAEAKLWFDAALEREFFDERLLRYNLGIYYYLTGDLMAAKTHLTQARDASGSDHHSHVVALIKLRQSSNGAMESYEQFNSPKLIEAISEALSMI